MPVRSLIRMNSLRAGAVLAALALFGCLFFSEDEPVANRGTEVENQVYGALVDEGGHPVKGAKVKVKAAATGLAKTSAADSDSAITDKDGRYGFKGLDAGVYNVQGDYAAGALVVLHPGIEVADTAARVDVGVDTLRAPGAIRGRLTVEGQGRDGALCHIPGTALLGFTDDSGVFVIGAVPQGRYSVKCASQGFLSTLDTGIEVRAKDTVNLPARELIYDTALPPPVPQGLRAVYDSSTGSVRLSWQEVHVGDLDGYVVYREDSSTVEPEAVVNGFTRTVVFVDSAVSRVRPGADSITIGYQVRSRDLNRNLSLYSAAVSVTLPVLNPPTRLSYAVNPETLWVSVPSADTASVDGAVDSFTVTPALPQGLALDKETGVVSGAPAAASPGRNYAVTARNAAGGATVPLSIEVLGPPVIAYPARLDGYQGTPIIPVTPTGSGVIDSVTVSPVLPQGLSLDGKTGRISGTPAVVSPAAPYVFSAWNRAGGSRDTMLLTLLPPPPLNLRYAHESETLWVSVPYADTPSVDGGVDSFTVTPKLPQGLSLDKATGIIFGTPAAVSPVRDYVVTAHNAGGIASATLTRVVEGLPGLDYPARLDGIKGQALVATVPALSGIVDSVTVSPALPPGLSVDRKTGRVAGTPASASASAAYEFSAWNRAGRSRDTVILAIAGFVVYPVIKDLGIDTGNATGWQNGFTGFFGAAHLPNAAFFSLFQFDLTHVNPSQVVSAKVRLKTMGYGPSWNGNPVKLVGRIFKLRLPWEEGTGNWYWHDGGWRNSGEMLCAHYGMSDSVRARSTNPNIPNGLLYTDHAEVRAKNIDQTDSSSVTVSYGGASVHPSFSDPFPGPENLVDLEFDVTNYVKASAGAGPDNGFFLSLENFVSSQDQVWLVHKEAGDGSYGARLTITY